LSFRAGNLASAAFFPVLLLLREPGTSSLAQGEWLLLAALVAALAVYTTFNGRLKRLEHDMGSADDGAHSPRGGVGGAAFAAAAVTVPQRGASDPRVPLLADSGNYGSV
jgi:hypothetical protein